MANFFKEYHAELRAKRQAKAEQERKARNEERERNEYIDGLKVGQKVKYCERMTMWYEDIIEHGFVVLNEPSSKYIWLVETKEEVNSGNGFTVLKDSIIIK